MFRTGVEMLVEVVANAQIARTHQRKHFSSVPDGGVEQVKKVEEASKQPPFVTSGVRLGLFLGDPDRLLLGSSVDQDDSFFVQV